MHHCEEFRERITEDIIDGEDIAAKSEFQHELLACSSCSEFYAESRELMEALAEIELTIPDSQWNGIQQRLHARILNAPVPSTNSSQVVRFSPRLPAVALVAPPRTRFRDHLKPLVLATTAALLVVTLGLSRLAVPVTQQTEPVEPATAVYVEHSVPLDPVTVDFLEESELLLRSVMKMQPADVEDLADARKIASEQLAELGQRKEAAAEEPMVVDVMETYETVLRDLRNVDLRSADDDISDIQKRIQKNGLIANLKAFQPRVTEISYGLR
jgi:hypothetical protein